MLFKIVVEWGRIENLEYGVPGGGGVEEGSQIKLTVLLEIIEMLHIHHII